MVNVTHKLVYVSMQHYYMLIFFCACGLPVHKAFVGFQLSIVRTTDQMVEDGLLLKAPHPGDRRALLLQLTDTGHQAAQSLNEQLNAQASRVLERLPAQDRPQVVRLLGALKSALEAELQAQTCCASQQK